MSYKYIVAFLFSLAGIFRCHAQRDYALIVGISNYGDEMMDLRTPAKDAKDLKTILDRHGLLTKTITSRNANKQNLLSYLRLMSKKATSADRLFFFYSGHGEEGCLITADKDSLYYTELVDVLSESEASVAFCFIDACHSGSVKTVYGHRQKFRMPINFCVACRKEQNAAEHVYLGNGYFSQALIKGLKGNADRNKDKQITLRELFDYVKKDVNQRAKDTKTLQNPQFFASEKSQQQVIIKFK